MSVFVRRLNELLGQLASASRSVGNPTLLQHFTDASAAIQRGIMFTGSLYL